MAKTKTVFCFQLLSALLKKKIHTEGGNRKSIELQRTDDWFFVEIRHHSTVTDFARFLGKSTLRPLSVARWKDIS